MNALEAASLVMIPSGYENGTLGSLKPTDGTGDFTFSRGSDISATRVNEDGYIEKGYENLLLQSNTFSDAAWSGLSKTSGILGYDGTNNAWEITKPAQPYTPISQSVSATGVWTFSLYAKANTLDKISIRNQTDGTRCDFDLLNGVAEFSGSNVISKNISNIGSGWYRCQVTFTGSTSQIAIYVAWNNSTAGSVYIQDAMINQGMVSYPYVETTTAPVAGGILEDMPRLDYTDSSCPSLKLEPQRTNRCTSSEYFEGAAWLSVGSPTITTNYGISPEGVQNSTRIVFSAANQCIYDGIAYTSEEVSTIYVKGTSGETIKFGKGDNIFVGTLFTLNGTWQRLEFVQSVSGNTFTINTSGGATARDIEIWGAQNEEASYPTSYIPTYGTSQTRSGDSCVANSIGDLIGQEQGSIYFEFNYSHNKINDFFFSAESDANNHFRLWSLSDYKIRFWVYANSVSQFVITTSSVPSEGRHKALFTYTDNNFNFYLDGVLVGTSLTGTSPIANTLRIKNINNETLQTLIFPTALSDDECIELTTI